MVEIITAVIVALLFSAAAGIVKLIKRGSLGSESLEIEKVLDKFGSTNSIEYEIVKGEETIQILFSPKQLSEFLRLKYGENKKWKDKDYELAEKIKQNPESIGEEILPEFKKVFNENLSVLIPTTWSSELLRTKDFDRYAISSNYPTIKIKGENGIILTIKAVTTHEHTDSIVNTFVNEIKSYGSKFITGNITVGMKNEKYPYSSCGYAYKIGKANQFGMIIACQFAPNIVITTTVSCQDDWSLLCSKLITTIIDSIEYDNP